MRIVNHSLTKYLARNGPKRNKLWIVNMNDIGPQHKRAEPSHSGTEQHSERSGGYCGQNMVFDAGSDALFRAASDEMHVVSRIRKSLALLADYPVVFWTVRGCKMDNPHPRPFSHIVHPFRVMSASKLVRPAGHARNPQELSFRQIYPESRPSLPVQ